MLKFTKKKTVAAAIIGLVTIGASIAAYAYWTTTGSGTGTAATGTTSTITANQTALSLPLRPGIAAQTLSGTFTNTSNSLGSVYVTTVTASIASVTGGAGACDASDYTLANAAMTVNAEVAAGTGVGSWTGATLMFNDKVTNQDGCKGATVNMSYAIA